MILQHPVFFWGGPTTSFVPAEYFFTFVLDLDPAFLGERWFEELGSTFILSVFSCWCFEEEFDECAFLATDLGWVGAFAFDFLDVEFFLLLFLLLDVFKSVVGLSVFWLWKVTAELTVIDCPPIESFPRLILAALECGPLGVLWFLPLLDEEFSGWLGLCCLTLDIERCFLRSERVCDWGCAAVGAKFGAAFDGLLVCVIEYRFEPRDLLSGDIFSVEAGESWLVTLTVI